MTARLTVIGGYLGAGKTTLLNGLLAGAGGARIAVVVNDFGAVNIDRRLITSATDDTVELSNGCICCTLQDDTSAVMTRLAGRGDLDHVVVETSGVGDPAALRTWGNYPGFTPGATVVCADSTAAVRLLRDEFVGDTVARQLTRADILVLTKADLAGEARFADARQRCLEHAADARVVESTGGDVHLKDLLRPAVSADPASTGMAPGDSASVGTASANPPPDEPDAHGTVHRSASVTGSGPVDRSALLAALRELPGSVVRLKGVVRCADSPRARTVVQYSGGRLEITTDGDWQDADTGGLVIIVAGDGTADAELRSVSDRLAEVLRG
ncbi:CobW family GTP-binding protein [Streptomyces sp. NBC_01089]|uniref:CobW family GTP-binding protein n=1 Tax=Streptomyces sp. NBC_01089 TaxID=2903747 RepID=UPI0038650CB5|nr:GTP-binding protein [Streptomyces sp. NBC_01089]